jgi:carboxyl-terminal processing protease
MSVFWEAWDKVEASFIGEVPNGTSRAYAAIRGSIALLNDPYTVFIEPQVREQERVELRGNFGGIGVILSRRETGGEVLLVPTPDNPAVEAGILDGDVLLAVDGQRITPEMSIDEIRSLVTGEKGTSVVLTVRHPDSATVVDITIERADILLPSVFYRVLEEDPEIGYIQLSRFSAETSGEMETAVETLTDLGVSQMVIDMRDNGGGLLNAAIDVADHFLDDGLILVQDSRGERQDFEADRQTIAGPEIPVIVLINGGTASASEILAGALQDRGRATLLGTQTYGKGSVQLVYDLSDGSSIHVTSARWYTPDGTQIDGQGLVPDIIVEPSADAIAEGRDEQLSAAVAFLQNGD